MDIKIILWLLGAGAYVVAGILVSALIAFDRGGSGSLPEDYSPTLLKLFNFSSEKVLGIIERSDLTMAGVVVAWPIVLFLKYFKI